VQRFHFPDLAAREFPGHRLTVRMMQRQ
jgi:hypothetical protein